ncbi:B12-binding domain-containing radical SAM protein [Oribacterium sp. WCC10]|uniref:B12-binding domain-containing radical SAM protein n=1 Tax=Oribacterium sp. WCC10 TaxID=1855343 RepID=UPI0008E043D0|nr:radical SAM protein [Oribacterium sp. WCC10]SFG36600.1 Radical SAM superfamily protein [Oribacterium sp. WCC10]
MKICFVNPPFKWEYGKFSRESRSPAVAKSGVLYYPLWLIYAAAYAEKQGFEVEFLDAPAKRLDTEESLKKIAEKLLCDVNGEANEINSKKDNIDADNNDALIDYERKIRGNNSEVECLFVLNTSTPSIESDAAFGKRLKEIYPKSFVYFVGTHPSSTPEETLKNFRWIDGIARKEYDFTISNIAGICAKFYDVEKAQGTNEAEKILYDELSHLKGISYRMNKSVTVSCKMTENESDIAGLKTDGKFSARRLYDEKSKANIGESHNAGEIIHNPDADYITDLDEIPMASKFIKEHLDYKDYFFAAAEYPEIQIFTGRGCPCRCNFCVYPQTMHGHKYRLRSPKNVVDEFKYIAENFPDVKEIVIEDDTFTIDKKRVSDICELLIESRMNKRFKWLCNARVNTLDLDTMKLMKKAGCRLLIPGIESGTQEILDNIKKGTTLTQVREYIRNTKKAGLLVHACYMVGNQGETKETMEKTLKLALELNTDTAQFFPLIPYPGTEAYEWAKTNGYIKYGYTEYCKEDGTHNCVLNLPDLSGEEMVKFCDDARKKYYLRPGYILHRLWTGLKDPNDLKRSLKAFGQFKKYLFKK